MNEKIKRGNSVECDSLYGFDSYNHFDLVHMCFFIGCVGKWKKDKDLK